MPNFNKAILAGYLTSDPELRYSAKGTPFASFTIGINRTYKKEDGSEHDEVCFVPLKAAGRTAEVLGQYMKKGKPILVEGRLVQETWDDKKTQEKRSKLVMFIESFQFLGDGSGAEKEPHPRSEERRRHKPDAVPAKPPEVEDDVPF